MTVIRVAPDNQEQPVCLTGGSSTRGTHQLISVSTCERLYALRYMKRLRIAQEPKFRLIGTLVHSALAYHYASMCEKRPGWFQEIERRGMSWEEVVEAEGAGYPDVIENAKDCFRAYQHRYAGDALTPLIVEDEFSASLGELDPDPDRPWRDLDNERVTCRVDLVALVNGKVWVVDHKCTGAGYPAGQRLPRWQHDGEWKMNLQVMMNLHILRKRLPELGYPAPTGFMINRIKRRVPYDFDRNPVGVPDLAYEEMPRQVRGLVHKERLVQDNMKAGIKPVANYGACWTRYGACDYHDFCGADSQEERDRIMQFNYSSG